jgi:hypothetical protein
MAADDESDVCNDEGNDDSDDDNSAPGFTVSSSCQALPARFAGSPRNCGTGRLPSISSKSGTSKGSACAAG